MLVSIHHIQLAMPEGGEEAARGFYGALLKLDEVPKPAPLQGRGGVWFQRGSLRLHLGVEPNFRPAAKAHPALQVAGLAALAARLEEAGVVVTHDNALPGYARFYALDPFGNRIEFLEPDGWRISSGAALR